MLQLLSVRRSLPVPIFPNKTNVYISPGTYIGICILILVFPADWVLSWLVAAAVHELAHYLALRICGVVIESVRLGLNGAMIITEPMSIQTECFAAAAGPLCGSLLIFTGRWFPYIAICSLFQTLFNLLPLRGFDGGRVIHCLLCLLVGNRLAAQISAVLELVCVLLTLIAGIYIAFIYKTGIVLPVVAAILILHRPTAKIPCKPSKQIVQCTQSNIRGNRHE